MIPFLFAIQFLIQYFYCKYAYTSFKNSPYFPYTAMFCGMISQFIWSQILRSVSTHTEATVSGVFFDSLTFLIWVVFPLIFMDSYFNKVGVLGVILIIMGMVLVGFQDLL